MKPIKLKELKKGAWFTKKSIEYPNEKQVWVKEDYDRSQKKYVITRWNDINDYQYMSGEREVYLDFIF